MTKANWVKGSLILVVSNLLSRILGLARDALLSRAGGIGVEVDAYNLAFLIPDLLNHVLGAGLLSVTLIPLISPKIQLGKEGEARDILNTIFSWIMMVLIVLTTVCFIFAPHLIGYLSDGDLSPELATLSVEYTRIVLFAQICFVAGGFFNAWQYTKYQYFLPALAPLVYNGGIIVGGLISLSTGHVVGFCWGVLGGAFIGPFLLQYIGARNSGWSLKISLKWIPEIKTYIWLTLPFAIGVSMTFSNEFLSKFFGTGEPGGVAILGYGLRITMALVGVLGGAVGIAAYPYLSELCAKKDYERVNGVLINTVTKVSILTLPILPVIYWIAPLVVEVYLGSKLEPEAVIKITQCLRAYLWVALPMSLQLIVNRVWYADQRTWRPALLSILVVAISFPFYKWLEPMGLVRIPYIAASASFVQLIVLISNWAFINSKGPWLNLVRPLLLTFGISLLSGLILLNFFSLEHIQMNKYSLLIVSPILVYIELSLVYFLGGLLAKEFLGGLRRKILRF